MLSEDTHSQRIKALETENAELRQKAATAFIESAATKKIVSDELKPELITLHMQNPKAADLLIKGLPDVPGTNAAKGETVHLHTQQPPASADQQDAQTANVMAAFGLTAEDAKKYGGNHGA